MSFVFKNSKGKPLDGGYACCSVDYCPYDIDPQAPKNRGSVQGHADCLGCMGRRGMGESAGRLRQAEESSEKPHDTLTKNPSLRTCGPIRSGASPPGFLETLGTVPKAYSHSRPRSWVLLRAPPAVPVLLISGCSCCPELLLDKSKWGERASGFPASVPHHPLTGEAKARKLE